MESTPGSESESRDKVLLLPQMRWFKLFNHGLPALEVSLAPVLGAPGTNLVGLGAVTAQVTQSLMAFVTAELSRYPVPERFEVGFLVFYADHEADSVCGEPASTATLGFTSLWGHKGVLLQTGWL